MRSAFLAAVLTLGAAGPARGADTSASPPGMTAEARRAEGLAALYGARPELAGWLRALGLEWVEVECALAIAARAERPVIEVLDLRGAGMEWGQVAQAYGFMLGEAIRNPGGAELRDAPAGLPTSPRRRGRRKAGPPRK